MPTVTRGEGNTFIIDDVPYCPCGQKTMTGPPPDKTSPQYALSATLQQPSDKPVQPSPGVYVGAPVQESPEANFSQFRARRNIGNRIEDATRGVWVLDGRTLPGGANTEATRIPPGSHTITFHTGTGGSFNKTFRVGEREEVIVEAFTSQPVLRVVSQQRIGAPLPVVAAGVPLPELFVSLCTFQIAWSGAEVPRLTQPRHMAAALVSRLAAAGGELSCDYQPQPFVQVWRRRFPRKWAARITALVRVVREPEQAPDDQFQFQAAFAAAARALGVPASAFRLVDSVTPYGYLERGFDDARLAAFESDVSPDPSQPGFDMPMGVSPWRHTPRVGEAGFVATCPTLP